LVTPCFISWLWSYSLLKVAMDSGLASRYFERGAKAPGDARTTSATAPALCASSAT